MGWTTTYKDPKESAGDFLKRKCLTWSLPPDAHPQVVGTATGSGCIAFAVRFPAAYWTLHPRRHSVFVPDPDGSITTALLFLINGGERGSRTYNFGYKDMDETAGPYAPVAASLLRHLSALDLENGGHGAKYAEAWRERCKAYSASRSERSALKDGARVILAEPLPFKGGFEAREFVVLTIQRRGRRQIVFRDVASGALCRLSARHLEGATYPGAATV